MSKPILVFWITLVLTIAPGLAAAQDSCFPHDVAVVQTDAHVRESSDFVSRAVQDAKLGDTFLVTGSKQDGDHCWIETSAGWLYTGYVKPESTPVPTPQTTATATGEVAATPGTQDAEDSCWPHDVVHVSGNVTHRTSHSFGSASAGKAKHGDTYDVIGSQQVGKSCWIETSAGWLYHGYVRHIADPPPAPEATLTPPATLPSGCYDADIAYVTGPMNIRASHSTDSEKVGTAASGDVFEVSASAQGETYCWLKVSGGWVAQTGRVRSTKPPAPAKASVRIEGDTAFIGAIEAALDYLREQTPRWYLYVTNKVSYIRPRAASERGSAAVVNRRRMEIHPGILHDTFQVAATLVHEACHQYQYDEGRWGNQWSLAAGRERETECYEIELDMVTEMNPRHRLVGEIRRALSNPLLGW